VINHKQPLTHRHCKPYEICGIQPPVEGDMASLNQLSFSAIRALRVIACGANDVHPTSCGAAFVRDLTKILFVWFA